jgi:hypothetical protein
MNALVEWSDTSCFKQFCLDRLAVGLPADLIARDVSAFVGRIIPVEQVINSCTDQEVLDRRKELLDEVRDSAPIISAELLSILNRIKNFIGVAEDKFNSEPQLSLKDFETYRKALELKLKAIDVANKQLSGLVESTRESPTLVINFDFSKLKQLEDEGVIKIIDVDVAKELVGDSDEGDVV